MIKFLAKIPIFKRIIPSIIKKLNFKKFKYRRKNLVYELDLRYLVDRRFYLYGWDDDIIEYLNNFIKEKNVIIFLILVRVGEFTVYKSPVTIQR